MKPLRSIYLAAILIFSVTCGFAQHSKKTREEKLILAKIKGLPEVQDYLKSQKRYGADLIVEDEPDSTTQFYSVTVGLNKKWMFLTFWRFFIDPKTHKIYFCDMADEGSGRITLEQWRHWRNKSEFTDLHRWIKGKLVVSKD